MARYDFRCARHGLFESLAGRGDLLLPCPRCGVDARREPSVPALMGGTVVRSIPEPAYEREAIQRKSRALGWDVDRAVRTMRGSMVEDEQGNKTVAAR